MLESVFRPVNRFPHGTERAYFRSNSRPSISTGLFGPRLIHRDNLDDLVPVDLCLSGHVQNHIAELLDAVIKAGAPWFDSMDEAVEWMRRMPNPADNLDPRSTMLFCDLGNSSVGFDMRAPDSFVRPVNEDGKFGLAILNLSQVVFCGDPSW